MWGERLLFWSLFYFFLFIFFFFFFKEKARGILFPRVAFSLPCFSPESKESRNNRGTSLVHSKLTSKVIWWRHYFHHVTSHLGNTQRFIWFFNEVCTPQIWYHMCMCLAIQSYPTLCAPWTIAYQVPLSMALSKQEFWHGLPFLSSGDLPDPGIEPASLVSPALAGRFFTTSALHYQSLIRYSHQALIKLLEALFSFLIWHSYFFSLCILVGLLPTTPSPPLVFPTL